MILRSAQNNKHVLLSEAKDLVYYICYISIKGEKHYENNENIVSEMSTCSYYNTLSESIYHAGRSDSRLCQKV